MFVRRLSFVVPPGEVKPSALLHSLSDLLVTRQVTQLVMIINNVPNNNVPNNDDTQLVMIIKTNTQWSIQRLSSWVTN